MEDLVPCGHQRLQAVPESCDIPQVIKTPSISQPKPFYQRKTASTVSLFFGAPLGCAMNISASSWSPHTGFLETQHSCSGPGQQAGAAQLAASSISLQINPFLTPPYQPNLTACLTLPFSGSTGEIIQACATQIYLLLPFISHPQHKAFCQATARAHLSNTRSSLTCIFHQQFSKQSA